MKCADVTLGITSKDNMQGLVMCLSAVLIGKTLPNEILLRLEGATPGFASYYFEQIADLARISGVGFRVVAAQSEGIRVARDWLLEECRTKALWMLDDDVLPDFECLDVLLSATTENRLQDDPYYAWTAGVKVDVNNRRGYIDWSLDQQQLDSENPSQNRFYSKVGNYHTVIPLNNLDTGNVLLRVDTIKKSPVRFSSIPIKANSGGEDTIFSVLCKKVGLKGYLAIAAQAVHLEKEKVRFSEQSARAGLTEAVEMLVDQKKL